MTENETTPAMTFEMSPSITKLMTALVKAQSNMGGAHKDASNPFYRSKYADLSEVIGTCKDALNDAGICFLQPLLSGTKGVCVKTFLGHVSGEYMSATVEFPVAKMDSQEYGKAVSYARRYSLQSMLSIPAEDDDGNAASGKKENPYTAAMFQDMPPDTWLSGILLGIDEPIKKGKPETARFQLANEMLITCDIQFCEEAWRGLEGQEVELMFAKKPKGVLVLVEMREKANGHDHVQATVGVTPVRTEQRKPTPKLEAVIQPHEINMETGDDVPHEQYTHPDDKADPQDWFEPGVLVRGFVTKIATKTGTSAKGPWEKTTFTIDPATGEELVFSTFALAKHFDLMSYDEVDKQAVWFTAIEGKEYPKGSGKYPLELDDIMLEPIKEAV